MPFDLRQLLVCRPASMVMATAPVAHLSGFASRAAIELAPASSYHREREFSHLSSRASVIKPIRFASGIVVTLVAAVYAAENAKPVQTILNKYAESVEKADQARTTSIDKAADSAITQLARVRPPAARRQTISRLRPVCLDCWC